MTMLAEVTTNAADAFPWAWLGWLLGGLTALVICLNQIDDFFKRRQPKPGAPPNEMLGANHVALSEKVSRAENSIRTLYKRDDEIRERINLQEVTFTREVATIKAQNEAQSERLEGMDEKLDRLIERKL